MPYHIDPKLIIDGTLYMLLVFSVLTWTLILFKLWQFSKNSYYNRRFNRAFWDAPDLATAKTLPKTVTRGPQARIARKGYTRLDNSRQLSGKYLKYCGDPDELLAPLAMRLSRLQSASQSQYPPYWRTIFSYAGSNNNAPAWKTLLPASSTSPPVAILKIRNNHGI